MNNIDKLIPGRTTQIADGWEVFDHSIIYIPGSSTADFDEQGYMIRNGNDRCLRAGIDTSGELVLWMDTSGGPVVFPADSKESQEDWFFDLGDAPDSRRNRIAQGIQRVKAAIMWLMETYPNVTVDDDSYLEYIHWEVSKHHV